MVMQAPRQSTLQRKGTHGFGVTTTFFASICLAKSFFSVFCRTHGQGHIGMKDCKEEPPLPRFQTPNPHPPPPLFKSREKKISLAPLAPMYCVFLRVVFRV